MNIESQISNLKSNRCKLKICGMKHPQNILEVSGLLPDYMGFIFYDKSARFLDSEIPEIHKSIKKTGVFVNASFQEIAQTVQKHNLQAVQLHGEESVVLCSRIQTLNVEVIKVFSIQDDFNFDLLKPFESSVDYFLFDTKGKLPGGNGYTFDWNVLKNYPSTTPFFLSGGIGIDEVDSIKQILKTDLPIYAIDINSKFETEPGVKNHKLLSQFMIAVSHELSANKKLKAES